MKKENLYFVLFEQQKTFLLDGKLVDREAKREILSFLRLKLPIVISGVRRSGKSTLLYIMKNELKLKEKECLYINFNDERLVDFSIENFQNVIDYLEEQEYNEGCYLFLDEIQEAAGWEKWVDRIKGTHPILITGSNSKLLSKEISTVLTGRSVSISLFPFNFREFLKAKKVKTENWKLDLKLQSRLRMKFSEFMLSGGIPKSVVENDKRILQETYENILYRDIVKRFNKNLEKPIKETSVYLLSNAAKEVSIRSLSKTIQLKNLSTAKSILESFEKAFLFFFVNKFDFSVRKQMQNPRKVYCVDSGFASQLGFRLSGDKGRILENLVFLELKRKKKELYYFAGKNECDFLVRKGIEIDEAIQVCYELNEESKERDIKGLAEAMDKFNLRKGMILTYDQEEEIKTAGKKITVKPVWKWLLE